ncbi:MAG: hypothetical protein K2F99_04285 [Muribaculaceae bacterium]|nr:hypothetical protein [Muribaculaceae bacterium]
MTAYKAKIVDMNKVFLLLLAIASALMAMAFKSPKVNGFEVVVLQDTLLKTELPDVDFRAITYNIYHGVTAAGF